MTLRSIMIAATALFLSAATAMAAPQAPAHKALQASQPYSQSVSADAPSYVLYAQNRISASKAKSIALKRVDGGEYVDLRLVGNTYIVRVRAPGGRIIDIRIDATTGRVK
ncbi:PepSY domain-containing protein [Litorimonas sp.]|uniref:PepSY domain-containing protein n=1 Tax=Litorimonas sp. TaxID=1892381 RepID=UPI003A8B03B0